MTKLDWDKARQTRDAGGQRPTSKQLRLYQNLCIELGEKRERNLDSKHEIGREIDRLFALKRARTDNNPPTENQIKRLKERGLAIPATRRQASERLTQIGVKLRKSSPA